MTASRKRLIERCRWLPALLLALAGGAEAGAGPSNRCDLIGTVDSIDHAAGRIVVRGSRKDGGKLHTYYFDDQTEVVKSRRPFKADDIRPEMRIWVYERDDSPRDRRQVERLTVSDPYPDIYGTVESVDLARSTVVVARRYRGSRPEDRRQLLTIGFDEKTEIRSAGEKASPDDVVVGRRVAITSRRDKDNKKTSTAAKITVYRESAKKAGGRNEAEADGDEG